MNINDLCSSTICPVCNNVLTKTSTAEYEKERYICNLNNYIYILYPSGEILLNMKIGNNLTFLYATDTVEIYHSHYPNPQNLQRFNRDIILNTITHSKNINDLKRKLKTLHHLNKLLM